MNTNFSIKDGLFFVLSGEVLEIPQLVSVEFRPESVPSLDMIWRIDRSNEQVGIFFRGVRNFVIRGRDDEYPPGSGSLLKIAGFSGSVTNFDETELYVEQSNEMDHMTFVMRDTSAFLVKCENATMQRL